MSHFRYRIALHVFILVPLIINTLGTGQAQETGTAPAVGVRFQPPSSALLTNATIVVSANKQIDGASLLIRDGKIAAVAKQIAPPAGVESIDCQGKYLYPAFVDALVEMAADKPSDASSGYWNSNVTPQRKMAQSLQIDKSQLENLRKAGVGAILAAPNNGIIKGQSCVLSTAAAPLAETLQLAECFQHVRLYPNRGGSESYPNSPMGATALVRQALLDADWYQRAQQAAATNSALPQPDHSEVLRALEPVIRALQRVVMDGTNELYALRADRLAREFSLHLVIRGSGREYRQLSALAGTGRTFIIPVNFPDAPKLDSEAAMADATLQSLMHWRLAPENPAKLEQAGVEFVITTSGLEKPTELLAKLRTAIAAGLSETKALQALTLAPAELLQVDHLVGSLETGKLANILITSGPLFAKNTKIEETWVQGKREQWQAELSLDPRGTWQLSGQAGAIDLQLVVAGKADKLTAKLGLPAAFTAKSSSSSDSQTESPSESKSEPKSKSDSTATNQDAASSKDRPQPLEVKAVEFDGFQLSGTFQTEKIADQPEGQAWLTGVLLADEDQLQSMHVSILWPDQSTTRYVGGRNDGEADSVTTADEAKAEKETESEQVERPPAPKIKPQTKSTNPEQDSDTAEKEKEKEEKGQKEEAESTKSETAAAQRVACEVNYPLGAYGRAAAPEQPEQLLIKNATVWTCDEAGILENADILIRRGIIEQLGHDLTADVDCVVVDATGQHISPGIIDCHSHMATDGGVNESGQAITAEVRIGDFIDCNDITIYRQLAGGVTTSNILHGSANPIGGQNQVIKLRWGALDEELKMREAPGGIKFALGENVKQSNREGNSSRYPQTRMGVEQIMRDRFEAARDYRQRWHQWQQHSNTLPPRRDLELEAIADVLEGKRWIHCHSYRQDEILMMLSLLDDYDITIGSLQHILEGYKVADAMAAHGATGSSFSDWWAYKYEVLDAIPYNGALMHRAGVVVSFNSDDAELARHLNHEAAKAVKYGGVEPSEALKFVTLNPAKQLRIDRWVGSLTPGKQADFVIWNRSPLSTLSMCMQTWIDGRKYFDRDEAVQQRERDEQLRQQLIQSAVAQGAGKGTDSDSSDPSLWWVRYDEFCHHGHDDHDEHHQHAHDSQHSAGEAN